MANPNAVVSARPSVWIDGSRVQSLEVALRNLSIRRTEGQISDCEAEFANWGTTGGGNTGFTLFGGDILDFGKRLEIRSGDDVLFQGRILSLEGKFPEMAPPTLVAKADDGLQDLRMVRRTRSFAQSTDADVLRTIANDHGLQTDISVSGPTHPVLVQSNQTDLEFAQERALLCDADLWLEDGKICCKPRSSRASTGFDLVFQQNLRSFSATADLAHQRTALVAGGWDIASKSVIKEKIDDAVLSQAASQGRTGPAVLQQALGDRIDTVVHASAIDAQEARSFGQARFLARARRFLRGIGKASCDARLKPARKTNITGLGPLFSGEWELVDVEHKFDLDDGFRTEFVCERAWIGRYA